MCRRLAARRGTPDRPTSARGGPRWGQAAAGRNRRDARRCARTSKAAYERRSRWPSRRCGTPPRGLASRTSGSLRTRGGSGGLGRNDLPAGERCAAGRSVDRRPARHRTSTAQVDNVVEGLVLGGQRAGASVLLTDATRVFSDFTPSCRDAGGVEIPDRGCRSACGPVAVARRAWFRALRLKGTAAVTRTAYWMSR